MNKIISALMLASTLAFMTTGCSDKALPNSRIGSISESYTGIVKAVEPVQVHGDGTVTSLLGMVAGGVLGHQIGGGAGKDLATMGGAVAGSIAGANADIKNAQLNLSFTRIRMPFTGRVLQTRFHKGALVHQQRDVLTTLVQMDPVHVIFNISRKQVFNLQRLKRGNRLFATEEMRAELELPDGSDYPQQGKIDFFSFLIDPSTDSVTVRCIFPNAPVGGSKGDYDLIPGQYAPVRLTVGENPDALLIPKPALIEDELGSRVLVVGKDNQAEARKVVTGGTYKQMLIINKGLKPGERVIVKGVQKVKDGMTVKPRAASPQPEGTPPVKS